MESERKEDTSLTQNRRFGLCFRLVSFNIISPFARRGRGAEGNPRADLHPAQYQHPYPPKSTTNLSGVHSLFAGLPIVEASHLPNDLPHISIRYLRCSLINTTSSSSNANLPGYIFCFHQYGLDRTRSRRLYPPVRFPRTTLGHTSTSGRTSRNLAVRFPRTSPGQHLASGRTNGSL